MGPATWYRCVRVPVLLSSVCSVRREDDVELAAKPRVEPAVPEDRPRDQGAVVGDMHGVREWRVSQISRPSMIPDMQTAVPPKPVHGEYRKRGDKVD